MIGGDDVDGGEASRALAADGWAVRGPCPAGTEEPMALGNWPSLILIDGRAAASQPIPPLADPGAGAPSIATIPVVVLGEIAARWSVAAVDDRLPATATPDEIVAALHVWQPGDLLAGARRLETVFGAAEIRAMVAGFRRQLVEAVALFDRSGEAGLAHRVAGIAGTLGFAAVGARWLALSEGDAAAWPDARREARKAIAAIDRDAGRA